MTLIDSMRQEVEAFVEHFKMPREEILKAQVLDHGQAYEVDREASARESHGFLRECFQNAALAALFSDEYTYVEGFASKTGFIIHHAWVVNREGKAVEVTWRDGGNECGYCVDGEREIEPEDDDEEATYEPCPVCGATGEIEDEHTTLEHAEYYGIAVDDDTLRAIIREHNLWGALHTRQDLDRILAAR